jgi:hypothetical protein
MKLLKAIKPKSDYITALLFFNIGVELGQLSVITLAFFSLSWWFKDKPWYKQRIVYPLSAIIASIALYWTITRLQ